MGIDMMDLPDEEPENSGALLVGPPVDEEDLEIRILLIHDPAHSNIGYIRMSWQLAGCSSPAGHVSTAKWTNQTLDIQVADRYHCDLNYCDQKGYTGICLTPVPCG